MRTKNIQTTDLGPFVERIRTEIAERKLKVDPLSKAVGLKGETVWNLLKCRNKFYGYRTVASLWRYLFPDDNCFPAKEAVTHLKRTAIETPEHFDLVRRLREKLLAEQYTPRKLCRFLKGLGVVRSETTTAKLLKPGSVLEPSMVRRVAAEFGVELVVAKPKLKDGERRWGSMSGYKLRKSSRQQNWLALHHAQEFDLFTVVHRHLIYHAEMVAEKIAKGVPLDLALDEISVPRATAALLSDLEMRLLRTAFVGAMYLREDVAFAKAIRSLDWLQQYAVALPSRVVAGIRQATKELLAMPYWSSVAQWSKTAITSLVSNGIRDGKSNREIAAEIRKNAKGSIGKSRAMVVARSEATNCLNCGAYESLLELQEHDPNAMKQWVSVVDQKTRSSHIGLSGNSVPVTELFKNGARWPGDPRLPAAERANCRCTMIADIDI